MESIYSAKIIVDAYARSTLRDVLLIISGASFTGIAAQIAFPVPGSPVPVTAQTFAVLITGATLGSIRGILSITLYALIGFLGVPWFANGTAGIGKASVGYIFGFIIAAGIVGKISEYGKTKKVTSMISVAFIGSLVIYTCGVFWLIGYLHISLFEALRIGVYPFLFGDALKIILAGISMPVAWRIIRRYG